MLGKIESALRGGLHAQYQVFTVASPARDAACELPRAEAAVTGRDSPCAPRSLLWGRCAPRPPDAHADAACEGADEFDAGGFADTPRLSLNFGSAEPSRLHKMLAQTPLLPAPAPPPAPTPPPFVRRPSEVADGASKRSRRGRSPAVREAVRAHRQQLRRRLLLAAATAAASSAGARRAPAAGPATQPASPLHGTERLELHHMAAEDERSLLLLRARARRSS